MNTSNNILNPNHESSEGAEKPAYDKAFAEDVRAGLQSEPKYLSSKYLYDKKGDAIFQQIMDMEEYYPTRCEYEIFELHKTEMLKNFTEEVKHFDLIEFGAGDGMKTKVLLRHFLEQKADFNYVPIDISANIVDTLTNDLNDNMPGLTVQGIVDDYFRAFDKLAPSKENTRKVVLFLGANIGNFDHQESIAFLKKVASYFIPGDRLVIGFDLKKDPQRILDAYFDRHDITKSFKLNLLERINRELGGNFKPDNFQYFPIYDPIEGAIRSHLVSKTVQEVYIKALDESFHFDAWEAMFMERSQKYSLQEIHQMAESAGFRCIHNFYDSREYFTDSLWTLA
ncbi:L-histidine N-alpha-methyltransferase [Catalinimonas alkaloidigena]|uniref:L-histidine N(alpha)-methyltransferase n=1 Tax=Catalinimonas alkaloidigena TaxID=1075417 RepID=UPI0024050990|nr:L-histidine N(alpha)-methyltransferase [Catalinimonas alkaloidigena]MDF9796736.1 L-histidine N-alpha-methyltransferase [Catalinimonas alkaloidigena]